MAQAVVNVLEPIQIQEEHCELIVFVVLRAFDHELQILCQQRAIRQVRQRVVKRSVTKVILALLQLHTDALLLNQVPVQFFDVTLGLLSALAFGLGTRTFSFGAFAFSLFGQRRRAFDFVKIFVVGKINDHDDRSANEQNRQPHLIDRIRDYGGQARAGQVGNGSPKIVCLPRAPNRLASLYGQTNRANAAVGKILDQRHRAHGNAKMRQVLEPQVGNGSKEQTHHHDRQRSRGQHHR